MDFQQLEAHIKNVRNELKKARFHEALENLEKLLDDISDNGLDDDYILLCARYNVEDRNRLQGVHASIEEQNRIIQSINKLSREARDVAMSKFGIRQLSLNVDVTNTTSELTPLQRDLKILTNYLQDKGWKSISFVKLKQNVHTRFTEEYATLLIETFPDILRRCRLSEGRYGVKIITAKINVESSTDSSEEVFEN